MKELIFFLIFFIFFNINYAFANSEDEIFIKAIDGDSYYQFLLGKEFEEKNNLLLSKDLFKISCENGYDEACEYLIIIYDKIQYRLNKKFSINEINSKLNEYDTLYNKKNYDNAIEILNDLCYNKKHLISCNNLAKIYYEGDIVKRDPKKAYEILSMGELSDNSFSNLYKAWILEYDFGEEHDINNAMMLYNKILTNSSGKIENEAKLGLERKYLYKFMKDVFNPFINYTKGNIKYDQVEDMLFNVSTSNLPTNIKNAFYNFRLIFLKLAKNNEESLLSIFTKNFFKGFNFDFSYFNEIKDNENLSLEGKHNMMIILEFLQEKQLSAKYFDNLFN